MKKVFLTLVIFTLLSLLLLSSCNSKKTQDNNIESNDNTQTVTDENSDKTDKSDKDDCEHSFSKWKTQKNATCKAEGTQSRTCSKCKKTEKRSIAKLTTHLSPIVDPAREATCEQSGLTEGTHCEYCNQVIKKQEVIPKLEHTVVIDKEIAATCQKNGLTEGSYCSVCQTVLVESHIIPKLEHTPVIDEGVEATCVSSGSSEGSHCSVCNSTIKRSERIEPLPHVYGDDGHCIDCGAEKSSYGLKLSLSGNAYTVAGIGSCTDTEIIIPSWYDKKPVSYINAGAFMDCTNIVSIEIPSSIRVIGQSAFAGCTSLERLSMSPSVGALNAYVFNGCEKLTEVDLSHIEAFNANCLFGSYIKNLTLSNSVAIKSGAFRECNVEYVYVDSSIKSIPANAFMGCTKLKEVVFEEGITSIGSLAFKQAAIETITFPSTLKTIDEDAFAGCKNLSTIDFSGAKVNTFTSSFGNCTNLSLIKNWTGIVRKTLFDYSLFEGVTEVDGMMIGNGWLLSCDKSLSGKVVVPEGIEHINSQAFVDCTLITEIELPSSLRTVGENAFSNCTALETVRFPEGVTEVGDGAFTDCNALTYVSFPDTMTEIAGVLIYTNRKVVISISKNTLSFDTYFMTTASGEQIIEFRGTKAEWQAYREALGSTIFDRSTIKCTDGDILQVYATGTIGSNVTYEFLSDGTLNINGEGEVAYKEFRLSGFATRITKLVFGEGITKVNKSFYGSSSFYGCINIEEIVFPSTLKAIDKRTFEGSAWYENFNSGSEAVYNGDALLMVPASISGTFTVKEGTVIISLCAFYKCTEITEIKLPTSVKIIEASAFHGCSKLENITLHEGIEEIGDGAFSYSGICELVIPSTVTEIDSLASFCTKLKKIVILDANQRTISGIVSYCHALETVIIGEGVESLPINTLNYCEDLKYVILSEDITSIDYSAFLYVPSDVKFLCYSETTANALKSDYADYIYMYSENEPSIEGKYWTFDADGNVMLY